MTNTNNNNKAQIVEIRYLENQESSHFNKLLRSVLPTAYCGNGDDWSISAGPSFGAKTKLDSNNIGAEIKAGIDLVNVKTGPVQSRIGFNADTGYSVGTDGVEIKTLGFGVAVGKKTGISTPFGEVSVDAEKCVIQ